MKKNWFIEKARRSQIVDCAIETIAEVRYAQASIRGIAVASHIPVLYGLSGLYSSTPSSSKVFERKPSSVF